MFAPGPLRTTSRGWRNASTSRAHQLRRCEEPSTPTGRLPIKADGLRIQLAAIQSALDDAFSDERSRGASGPHNYVEFLAELPPTGTRRARFPPAPPDECEAPDTEPTPSARIDELFRLVASELRPERVNRYLREVLREADSLEKQAAQHAVRSRAYAALAVEASTAGSGGSGGKRRSALHGAKWSSHLASTPSDGAPFLLSTRPLTGSLPLN